MKARVVVHHLATDNYWYGKFVEFTKDEYKQAEEFIQQIAESGDYMNLETSTGQVIFPKELIQQCVMTLENSAE